MRALLPQSPGVDKHPASAPSQAAKEIIMAGMAAFDWADPFFLDDQLTDDERMIRDTAQAYAADKLAPRVIEAFNDEITDPEIFGKMGALGLPAPTIPAANGGAGAGNVPYGLTGREVGRPEGQTPELRSPMQHTSDSSCLKKK